MELSWLFVFNAGASLAGVIAGIGMFSELSWSVKTKVTAVLLAGIILIGLFAWPLAAPLEPFGVVSVPNFGGAIALIGLAVLTGFIGYFLSWPYGREIGILAVPAGLAVWAVRCGNMTELMRINTTLAQRQEMLASLKWEPVFWLAVAAAGFGGVLIGQKIIAKPKRSEDREKSGSNTNIYLNSIIALAGSCLIAQLCIGIFAQDVRIADSKLGSVLAQPPVGQIVFAILVSFGAAAFLVKKFFNASYIWPIAASALVHGFVIIVYIKHNALKYIIERYSPAFFSSAVISILPIQMVAFGVFGSIAGYWLAVCYDDWQKHL